MSFLCTKGSGVTCCPQPPRSNLSRYCMPAWNWPDFVHGFSCSVKRIPCCVFVTYEQNYFHVANWTQTTFQDWDLENQSGTIKSWIIAPWLCVKIEKSRIKNHILHIASYIQWHCGVFLANNQDLKQLVLSSASKVEIVLSCVKHMSKAENSSEF